MKKLFTSLSLLICVFVNAQEKEKNFSEVKFNALSTSLGTVEVEFERTLNSKSSIGFSAFTTFEDSGAPFSYDFDSGITAFYRYYLGKKYANGIFFEGSGTFHNTSFPVTNLINTTEINTNLLVGLGVGYKYIFKKGLVLQANFGPGINVFEDEFVNVSGRAGISIGYRF